ncbi:MAG: hypothetical protein RIA63_13950, partial [Cyclobacteriaceae bacterium]
IHDKRPYVIEFSDLNIYSFKVYRIDDSDETAMKVDSFMRYLDTMLDLQSKLLAFINRLDNDKCYQIDSEFLVAVCPGNKKKENKINNKP